MDAKPDKPTIREQDVRGLKYFDQLAPLLEQLHDVGCDTDRSVNRSLHFDNSWAWPVWMKWSPTWTV